MGRGTGEIGRRREGTPGDGRAEQGVRPRRGNAGPGGGTNRMQARIRSAARGAVACGVVVRVRGGIVRRRSGVLVLVAAVSMAGMAPAVVAQETVPAGPAVVAAAEPLLLREQPSYDAAALATVGPGEPVEVVGEITYGADGNAWAPVVAAGQSGFLPAGAVAAPGAAAPAADAAPVAETAPAVPMAEPAPAAEPVPIDPAAVAPEAAAAPVDAAVAAPGTEGTASVPAAVADAAPMADPAAAPPAAVAAPIPGTTAAATSEVNLRAGPSYDDAVLTVLPPGAAVSVDGEPVNGFVPVTAAADGASGWIDAQYLGPADAAARAPAPASAPTDPVADPAAAATGDAGAGTDAAAAALPALPEPVASEAAAAPAAAPAPPADAPPERGSAGIAWPFAGGTWHVIQGYNNGTHTNRSGFAQYQYSLDWAREDGDTAGQPIYAPVSGSVDWTDGGSGGILIDIGDGYGVAMFHLTLDGGLRGGAVERGQRIGVISGPGGPGYMSTAHVDMTLWKLLPGGGHEAAPWVGRHAIAGQEFPDVGGANQHMGVEVTP